MTERAVNKILVNSRTIKIGSQVLAIAEIARMNVFGYQDRHGYSAGDRLLQNASIGAFLVGLIILSFDESSEQGNLLAGVGAVVAIAVALYANTGPYRRILVLELSSGGLSTLSAKQFEPLDQLQYDIAQVIENPPVEPKVIHVGNVINTIDLRNSSGIQVGNQNRQSNFGAG